MFSAAVVGGGEDIGAAAATAGFGRTRLLSEIL